MLRARKLTRGQFNAVIRAIHTDRTPSLEERTLAMQILNSMKQALVYAEKKPRKVDKPR